MSKRVSLEDLIAVLRARRTSERFSFEGEDLAYLFHSYNNLGLTERSVEIPIIKHYLSRRSWQRVLEVGNVTNYYESEFAGLFPNKTVVDKLERHHNVVTSDIADYTSGQPFDFIFSISTFEHMDSDSGRNPDYRPGEARFGSNAADNMVHCYEHLLAPDGLMVITAPLGYATEWDETFFGDTLESYGFKTLKKHLVSRIAEQHWEQQQVIDKRRGYEYGVPYPFANHVSVVEIAK